MPLILATLLSWASIPLFLKWFVPSIDAWTANGWRYGVSALFWLPVLAWAWRAGRLPRAVFAAAVVPALLNAVGQSAFGWCPYYLDPGFFTFVFRVQIVFVALGAFVLFPPERPTLKSPRFWIGVALVAVGSVGLVAFSERGLTVPQKSFGVGLALVSSALFAAYGLAIRKYMHGIPAVYGFGVVCQYTAVLVVLAMLIFGRDVVPERVASGQAMNHGSAVFAFSGFQWFMLVLSAMIGIALSHVSYYAAIKRLGVAVSMGIVQLQPVITGLASMLIFNERLTAGQWAAGLVGVVGAMVILSIKAPAAHRAEAAGVERSETGWAAGHRRARLSARAASARAGPSRRRVGGDTPRGAG
jgi:drug/metabolite transporter (DMT)-like permease